MKSNIVIFKYSFETKDNTEEYYTPQFITIDELVDFVNKILEDNDFKNFELNYPEESLFGFSVELGSLQVRCERICNPNPEDFVGKELFSSFPWTRVETLVQNVGVKKEKTIDSFEGFLEAIKNLEAQRQAEPVREWI